MKKFIPFLLHHHHRSLLAYRMAQLPSVLTFYQLCNLCISILQSTTEKQLKNYRQTNILHFPSHFEHFTWYTQLLSRFVLSFYLVFVSADNQKLYIRYCAFELFFSFSYLEWSRDFPDRKFSLLSFEMKEELLLNVRYCI